MRRLFRQALALVPIVLAGAAASAAAPQQPEQPSGKPVFRSGTTVVEVSVIVRDRNGVFVPDLTADDFEVRDNDEPQRIESLYLVAPPGVGGSTAPDTRPGPRTAERAFLFLFDMEHLSPGGLTRARDAAARFVAERMTPADRAGLLPVSATIAGGLSTDHPRLIASLKALRPRADAVARARSLREWPRIANEAEAVQIGNNDQAVLEKAVQRACDEAPGECEGGENKAMARRAMIETEVHTRALNFVRESRAAGQRSVAALDRIARLLGALPGRKTVIWITEGSFSDELAEQATQAAYRAAQAGVAVYALDPRGLGARTRGGVDHLYSVDEAGTDVLMEAAGDPAAMLTAGSSGLAIRNENNLDRALQRIEQDTSTYYVLGYSAPPTAKGSTYRRLHISVRRKGAVVRARHGYMAPRQTATLRASAGPLAPFASIRLQSMGSLPGTAQPLSALPPGSTPASVDPAHTAAASPAAATLRQRPDAAAQIEALAAGGTASTGDLARKGWDAYQRGDVETAYSAFALAGASPKARPWVLYALGLAQVALGRPRDAIASWERVRRAAPEFTAVYVDLADTYVQLNELTNALIVLRAAESRWPGNDEIHNAVGVIHFKRGVLDDAIEAFTHAARAAPSDPLAYFNVGRMYELRYVRGVRYVSSERRWVSDDGDRDKAEENYRRCVDLGGPYAQQALEAISRLQWAKR